MNIRIIGVGVGLATATAIAAAGLPVSLAHATENCLVSGGLLDLHHSSGYNVAIDASGSLLGPKADISTSDANAEGSITSGGITGRTLDFTIGWPGTLAYVHFVGTVGADGIAHGTSTATITPIDLHEGSWDSVGPLTCS